jgi:hypothetical protein
MDPFKGGSFLLLILEKWGKAFSYWSQIDLDP